ncbi:MAG: TIGR04282 family arsenosugar biosynthesis glycosyltransferase [Saprospiraceae bacterium]|nr:TIGR04282 family arsenosugar biosynthesis glycosyltransferase [Saprospiraceae bacterium]
MPQIPVDAGLIVFLRLPEKGKVKTRLAATLGEDAALKIYNDLICITLDLVSVSEIPTYLFYAGGLPHPPERNIRFSYHHQSDGDLGSKMADALSIVLNNHKKALIIGSDCPDLTPEILHTCCQSLDEKDIVLGPTEDGGYYLLGCKALNPALFANIKWGTPSVLGQTIEKIQGENLSYCLLQKLQDIDTAEDWNRYTQS